MTPGSNRFFHTEAVCPSLELTYNLAGEARRFQYAHVANEHRIRRGV